MANKRVAAQPGRKSGVVKQTKKSATSNRAFYLLAAGLGIAGIVALTYQSTRPKGLAAASPVDTTLPPVQSEGYVLGSANAPLEVIEFGDFECPQCGRFATLTEPDVRSRLITPREGARLMGLPESYRLPARDTAAMHVIGDGVAVPVVRWLAERLLTPLAEAGAAEEAGAAA